MAIGSGVGGERRERGRPRSGARPGQSYRTYQGRILGRAKREENPMNWLIYLRLFAHRPAIRRTGCGSGKGGEQPGGNSFVWRPVPGWRPVWPSCRSCRPPAGPTQPTRPRVPIGPNRERIVVTDVTPVTLWRQGLDAVVAARMCPMITAIPRIGTYTTRKTRVST